MINPTEIVVIGISIFALGICLGWLARADWEIRPERAPRNTIPRARVNQRARDIKRGRLVIDTRAWSKK
jgi:hypothetical protein